MDNIDKSVDAEKQVDEISLESSLLDYVTDSIFVHDFAGNLIYVNEAAYSTRGYTREELMNLKLHELDAPENAQLIASRIQELNEKNKIFFESAHRCKDGSVMYVENYACKIDYYDQQLILTVARDVTEKKRAEEKLIESEKRYRTTFEHTGTAMIIIEEDTTVSLVNEEFEKLSGYSKEELEGKVSWTEFIHPGDVERMKNYHYARRRGEYAPREYEARLIDKGGEVKDADLTVGVIPGSKSVVSLMDISYTKRVGKLLSIVSDVNEMVGREHNPTIVLDAVCEKLNILYESVFTSVIRDGKPVIIRSEGFSIESVYRVIDKCPSVSTALEGRLMKLATDSELCQQCTGSHNHVLSLPLIHDKQHGIITIHSKPDFSDEEIALLDKLASNIAFALSAYEVEKEREFAFEQLLTNLLQFDRSADRLRNPLAVIMSSLELKESYGKDKVLRIVGEQANKIQQELDEMRKEETNTFELIEHFGVKAERIYENKNVEV
ncbi:MAG: PAS domain S-box protein [Archaeoglobaceae archaeon]